LYSLSEVVKMTKTISEAVYRAKSNEQASEQARLIRAYATASPIDREIILLNMESD